MEKETGETELGRFLKAHNKFSYDDLWNAWCSGIEYAKDLIEHGSGDSNVPDFGTWLHERFTNLKKDN